jgi:FkbM family methyltransferase
VVGIIDLWFSTRVEKGGNLGHVKRRYSKGVLYYLESAINTRRLLGYRGLIKRIKWFLSGKPSTEISVCLPNIRHPLNLRFGTSDLDAYEQIFMELHYYADFKTSPRVIVDAGANIGLASIYFANCFPQAKIFAVEPELSNFRLLERNVRQYANVMPIRAALWSMNTTIDLIDPGKGHWGFQTVEAGQKAAGDRIDNVTAITVDRLMNDHEIDHIDVLKIDIEGAEQEVFADPSKWINRVSVLIVELHERIKIGCTRTFYNATNGFDHEWMRSDNVYLARKEFAPLQQLYDEHYVGPVGISEATA